MSATIKLIIHSLSEESFKENKQDVTLDLEHDVVDVKHTLLSTLSSSLTLENLKNPKCELIHQGRILQPGYSLGSYGLKDGMVLLAVFKEDIPLKKTEGPVDDQIITRIVMGLRKLVQNGHTAKLMELVTDRRRLETLIATSPGLGHDIFAYSLIQDVTLVAPLLSDRENIRTTLRAHPCLAAATLNAIDSINREVGSSGVAGMMGQFVQSGAGQPSFLQDFSVDQEMDDESDEEEGGAAGGSRGQGRGVSRDQLAAAIAEAGGQLGPAMESVLGGRPQQRHMITPDLMRSALNSALAGATAQPPPPAPAQPQQQSSTTSSRDRWRTQLDQLRDMGVTDEAAAVQALEVAEGNLEIALNILFS